jgi:hypothetical protein
MARPAQKVRLRILADEQRELDARQLREQPIEPEGRTFAPRRQVATGPAARIAQAHRLDRNACLALS